MKKKPNGKKKIQPVKPPTTRRGKKKPTIPPLKKRTRNRTMY